MRTNLLRRLFVVAALALATAAVVPIDQAEATTLAPLTVEQVTDASTYIVRGELVRVWTDTDESGLVWTRAELDVKHVFKGPDHPETLIIDTPGGSHAGSRTAVHSAARFSTGEDMVIFLDEISGDRYTPVGMFLGKYTVRRAPQEDRQHVVRFSGKPNAPYDHRFLVHPKAEDRFYLEDLIERVETRLDVGWDGQPIPGISPQRLRTVNTLDVRRRN
jgi:hypothetical protein